MGNKKSRVEDTGGSLTGGAGSRLLFSIRESLIGKNAVQRGPFGLKQCKYMIHFNFFTAQKVNCY